MAKEKRTPIPGARDKGAAFGAAIKVDYRALLDTARAVDSADGVGDIKGVIAKLEGRLPGIDDEFPSKWQAAGERKWTLDAITELKEKVLKFEAAVESPVTLIEVPPEVLSPELPEGLGEGWYRRVPCEGGRVEVFVRALDEGESNAIQEALFRNEQGRRKKATYFEVALKLEAPKGITLKGTDYFGVKVHDNLIYRIRPRNRNYKEAAEKALGASHGTTKELDLDEMALEPGNRVKKLLAFDEGNFDKPLDVISINKFLCGEWPLHRTRPMLYPPGLELPAETVLQLVMPRKAPKPGDRPAPDPWANRTRDWGEVEGGHIVSGGVEVGLRLPPKDELVQFYSDEPAFVPNEKGIAFVKATCALPGQKGLIDAEAITNVFRGGASGITNVLPSWDPRAGPPDLPAQHLPELLWRAPTEEREPMLAISGSRIIVGRERDALILDFDGRTVCTAEVRGKISAVAACPEGFLVAHSGGLDLIDADGKQKFSLDLDAQFKSLAALPDGTILAGLDPYYTGGLALFDSDGKSIGTVEVPFSNLITPMPDGRVLAVDGNRRPGIMEAGGSVQLSMSDASARGLALSKDSKRIFVLQETQQLACYSPERTRQPTKNELEYPKFPNAPLMEALWQRRLPETAVSLAYLPEIGVLASAIRLGLLYLHSEDGRILWRGRFKGDCIWTLAAIPGTSRLLVATEEPALYCVDLAPALK